MGRSLEFIIGLKMGMDISAEYQFEWQNEMSETLTDFHEFFALLLRSHRADLVLSIWKL